MGADGVDGCSKEIYAHIDIELTHLNIRLADPIPLDKLPELINEKHSR
jgi:hypothetical protein